MLAVKSCYVHGRSESRKSSFFWPVVEVSYVVPVRHAVSRVSPIILVVEVVITTTSPCIRRTGSAHVMMTQLVSKISASTAEHMWSVTNCKKGAPGVQRTLYPAFETESLIGVCATATPSSFSHIVGELFPGMKVDTTLASIQLFGPCPCALFGSQELAVRRCWDDRSEIASGGCESDMIAQVKKVRDFQVKLDRQTKYRC